MDAIAASEIAAIDEAVAEAKHIKDRVSGRMVPRTPEEEEAVQPFINQLIDDYGYPTKHLQTRPQFHVKASPSDTKKKYPVDIAVFSSDLHDDANLRLIVECKKKRRKDGRTQLEDYMRLSQAELGVWFNGEERLFLRKVVTASSVLFEEIPNIPRYGERIEDIGLYTRESLRPTHNLRSTFRAIRNYLAANAVGMTRDEALAQQIINLIFCKIYDERFTAPSATVRLRAGVGEAAGTVAQRARDLFKQVCMQYDDVFDDRDELTLDDESMAYVIGELQPYSLMDCDRDVVADAFETFIGPSLKGAQGQFFTPRNVVRLTSVMVSPTMKDRVVDPACGSGGFLIEMLREMWAQVDQRGDELSWPQTEIENEKQKVAIRAIRGIDKDSFLSKVAKAYMAVLGDGRGGVFCENSLASTADWKAKAADEIRDGSFDIVVTNPPFGKKLKVGDHATLTTYDLAHKWTRDPKLETFVKGSTVVDGQAPQILFVEKCLRLLKPGGRLGIVLPESLLCNPSHKFIVNYILSKARIRAVVSMPEDLFQPYTHAKTAVVLIEKFAENDRGGEHPVFMALARWCGHDSRGHAIPNDDLPAITDRLTRFLQGDELEFDHLGFTVSSSDIQDDIYLPKYYNPELQDRLAGLEATHELVRLGDLAEQGVISVNSGHEVGKLAYGTGAIPFIRTSDIANWEIKGDPKHGVSPDIFASLAGRQNVEIDDILMVRDGTYLVGTCAIVTELDARIVFQSHILKIKVHETSTLDPKLLLALLSSPIVKEQIWSKRFTQDIIDTLGVRWRELVVPIPRSATDRKKIAESAAEAIQLRIDARLASRRAVMQVAPHGSLDPDVEYDFLVLGR
ncbi:N-6 DNA methylase [Rathayibacter rathayi]|uniref:N-6 DNA methylase n=1 Tax=Rathayibacter rathayi TaxID=33887 RepID=UPI000CE8FA10|nr:N-6 DNA methylase [Rathayibacter rathayi]PPH67645.1 DNA methyltransferase [Rathayibacter rathayi]PPI03362.1 DNA methyltransferase [Rathayibacter rathayi]PPI10009.1 DNA methyltransferase [Rathayibacter rathayi]